MEKNMETTRVRFRVEIGIAEKNMETTMMGYIGTTIRIWDYRVI